jgi:hypothetical protein
MVPPQHSPQPAPPPAGAAAGNAGCWSPSQPAQPGSRTSPLQQQHLPLPAPQVPEGPPPWPPSSLSLSLEQHAHLQAAARQGQAGGPYERFWLCK